MDKYDVLTEICLRLDGAGIMEFYGNSVPRIGEKMDIRIEDIKGMYIVEDVVTTISKLKDGKVISYVTVHGKSI